MKGSSSSPAKVPDSPFAISQQSFNQLASLTSFAFSLPIHSSFSPEAAPPPVNANIRYLEIKDNDVESDEALWGLYERWITHAEMSRSVEEKQKRFPAFKENVKYIHSENKTGNFPYELRLNKFSDMSTEEFERSHTAVSAVYFKHLEIKDSDLKSDKTLKHLYKLWMTRYRVSRSPNEKLRRFNVFKENVKHIHSENKKNHLYKLGLNRFSDWTTEEFEKQRMVACPSQMLQLYDKIMDMGVMPSKDYSNQNMVDGPRLTLDGYNMIPPNDEKALEEVVNKCPVWAFIDARGDAFKNYRGGVLTEESGKDTVFMVTIVGCGVTPCGVMYWEIQNVWGPLWGEGGFIRIKKGVNLCGIASFATNPVINKSSALPYSTRG